MSTKVSAFPASGGLVLTDIFPVVDDPGGFPASQKATFTQLVTLLSSSFLPLTYSGTTRVKGASDTDQLILGFLVGDGPSIYISGNNGGAPGDLILEADPTIGNIKISFNGYASSLEFSGVGVTPNFVGWSVAGAPGDAVNVALWLEILVNSVSSFIPIYQ